MLFAVSVLVAETEREAVARREAVLNLLPREAVASLSRLDCFSTPYAPLWQSRSLLEAYPGYWPKRASRSRTYPG